MFEPLGIVFAGIGLSKNKQDVLSIVGLVLSIIGLIFTIIGIVALYSK